MSSQDFRTYKRSVAFLLGAAVKRNCLKSLSVMESVGSSFHFSLNDSVVNENTAAQLLSSLLDIIKESIPISLKSVPRDDAIKFFEGIMASQTVEFLRNKADSNVMCHCCDLGNASGVFMALSHGSHLLTNTSEISPEHVNISVISEPFSHYRLFHASPNKDGKLEIQITQEPKLLNAYAIRKNWAGLLNFQSVTNVNKAITDSKTKSLIQLSEALHDHQIVTIATQIAGHPGEPMQGSRKKLVLIAGPSSSGKTTFAKRLSMSLETLGARPIVISVDSYYKAWQDIDSRGMQYVDWESLKSLNLELLNSNLIDLIQGKEVLIPEYDMKTSMPMSEDHWVKTKVPEGGIIIMEGIHCLNPALTPRVQKDDKFQIMISPLSGIALDDMNVISTSQIRMMRRMVRDFLFRGRSAVSTLKQWPGVVLGERNNIYPNQNNADVVMNSGLVYEAKRLLNMLDNLVSMPSNTVPPQSLLCEFIGGSWYYDYAGMYKTA